MAHGAYGSAKLMSDHFSHERWGAVDEPLNPPWPRSAAGGDVRRDRPHVGGCDTTDRGVRCGPCRGSWASSAPRYLPGQRPTDGGGAVGRTAQRAFGARPRGGSAGIFERDVRTAGTGARDHARPAGGGWRDTSCLTPGKQEARTNPRQEIPGLPPLFHQLHGRRPSRPLSCQQVGSLPERVPMTLGIHESDRPNVLNITPVRALTGGDVR